MGVLVRQCLRPGDAFDGARWSAVTTDCARIGHASLPSIRGLVFHESTGTFVAVYQYRGARGAGFFYSTSTDLVDWSEPTELLVVDLRLDAADGEGWAAYPSLVDGESGDRNFGTIGESASLFFVRFEPTATPGKVLRRLIAVPITVRP